MKNEKWTPYIRAMLAIFGAISLSVVFFFLLYRMQGIKEAIDSFLGILAPFIYGGVIAYLLCPMCNAYEEGMKKLLPRKMKKLSNGVAVTLSMLTGLLAVYMLIIMIAPQLLDSIVTIWNSIPDRLDELYDWAVGLVGEEEDLLAYLNKISASSDTLYTEVERWVTESLLPQINSIMGGVGSIVTGVGSGVIKLFNFVLDLLIGLIVAVYLLGSRKRFARQGNMLVRSILKPSWADLFLDEVRFVDRMFSGFIDGKIVDSAIIGVLCYIGCVVFRFPNALLVSAIVGVTNVIPFFGPFIGAVPATLLIMIENPIKGLWFILFVFVLQQLDGNIIGPKILGDRTGLSSFWVLLSIVVGGGLWGLVGMIICVPLFAVIYDLAKRLIRRGLKRNGCPEVWEDYRRDYGEDETASPPEKIPSQKAQEQK